MAYGFFHNTMLPGKVMRRLWNPLRFIKHAYFKVDAVPTILDGIDPNGAEKSRETSRKAKLF